MMRKKSRYLLVETSRETNIESVSNLEREFYRKMRFLVGEMNYHRVNPRIMRFLDPKRLILKVNFEGLEDSILALALMKRFDNADTAFWTLKSSGTIKALVKKIPTLDGHNAL